MDISAWSINAYTIFVIVSGLVDLCFAGYLRFKGVPGSLRRLWAGASSIIIGGAGLLLFRNGTITDTWVLFIAVSVLLAITVLPQMLPRMIKDLSGETASSEHNHADREAERENWTRVRSKGKLRFVGSHVFLHVWGILWIVVLLKIILLDRFPIYFFVLIVGGAAAFGYLSGTRNWERNEECYLSD